MRPWSALEAELEAATAAPGSAGEPAARAAGLLALGEEVICHYFLDPAKVREVLGRIR